MQAAAVCVKKRYRYLDFENCGNLRMVFPEISKNDYKYRTIFGDCITIHPKHSLKKH
jgi:hypothetical protein